MASPRRPVLIVNPRSGGGRAGRAGIGERARGQGIDVVVLGPGRRLKEVVEEAVTGGADALGIAGGDGSLAIVAAAASAHGLPFVCVPTGTRNHFARDLGLDPRDPAGALHAFAHGVERRIDLGEVNGRLFLNNVSLGVYGDAVRRPVYRDAKARTLLETARSRHRASGNATGLRLADDRGHEYTDCALVLVSNNPYAPDPRPRRGGRSSLQGGRLGVIAVEGPQARAWTTTHLEVRGAAPVHAGCDGEPVELGSPLEFVTRPAALRIMVPGFSA